MKVTSENYSQAIKRAAFLKSLYRDGRISIEDGLEMFDLEESIQQYEDEYKMNMNMRMHSIDN